MGSRSITKITFTDATVRYYLHWGSPDYQIPNMAEFVFWAWSQNRPWELASYQEYLTTVEAETLPAEPTEDFHGDLEHFYRITLGADGALDYRYRHLGIDDEDWTEVFHATDRAGLYAEAIRQLEADRNWVLGYLGRHPCSNQYEQHLAAIEHAIGEAQLHARIESLPGASGSASQADFHTRHECDPVDCSIWTPESNRATEPGPD